MAPKKKKHLVIVESPAKAKTIEKYLGKNDYKVVASMGHIRDLPKSRIGINLESNFEPDYIIMRDKRKILKELKAVAKKSDIVYLAPDPDREGEAIAWHLQFALGLTEENSRRIEFNEITKKAVVSAVQNPREIDMKRVNAQQARRLLDRLVGYSVSPILWKKIQRGLSAGRVQSVAVRLICDREEEIEAFNPKEFWTLPVEVAKGDKNFAVRLVTSKSSEEVKLDNENECDKLVEKLKSQPLKVADIRIKKTERKPYAPYITSTLQQDASNRLGFTARKAMMVAQQLYEGLVVEGEQVGLITYMRTDSVRISDDAIAEVRDYIGQDLGADYLPEAPNKYKSKKSAQDAHEAIRPSAVVRSPKSISKYLNTDQNKLYKLIWDRFVASQMLPAKFEQLAVDIAAAEYILRANSQKVIFDGFYKVYPRKKDDDSNVLPELEKGDELTVVKVNSEQHFTQPPPRYNEASLVKLLEELGIGRPSTYAPIVSTIISRNYVERQDKKMIPTKLGRTVNNQMKKFFSEIVDVSFTADLEEKLDSVMDGDIDWKDVLKTFYQTFKEDVKKAQEEMEDLKVPDRPTDEICTVCNKPMVIKQGRFGDFLACTGFPECKETRSIPKFLPDVHCPICKGPVVERKSKKGRVFFGCGNYPECMFVSWDRPVEGEACEQCGNFLIEKKVAGELRKLCISCDHDIISPKKV